MAVECLRVDEGDLQGVDWSITVPDDISLEIARHQIVVALANILINAVESLASGDGSFRPGRVEVIATAEDEQVRIAVSDDGMGLAAEDLREISEFIPGRTSKKNHGTGFGLPIARRNIAAHGGTIAIDSWLNQGTTVTITLPLASHPEAGE